MTQRSPNRSRKAAKDYSPRRKPREVGGTFVSPEGA